MAYSPETLYAATGTSTASRTAADDVEVGQRRLHHHDVGALVDVEQRLADALDGVGGVLLVGPPVALQRGVDGLAERAVERGGVLRGVGQDRRRRWCPAPSSAARITATWPSIIPLGPTMSTPAAAWASAISAYTSRVRVVVDARRRASSTPQWPWSVNSSRHRSLITGERVADLGDARR